MEHPLPALRRQPSAAGRRLWLRRRAAHAFQAADAVSAGQPFLVRPARDVDDPTFPLSRLEAAAPQSVGDADCQFVGTFNPVTLPQGDGFTSVFLTADGHLRKPADRRTLGPFRAYFRVSDACRQLPCMMIYETINN